MAIDNFKKITADRAHWDSKEIIGALKGSSGLKGAYPGLILGAQMGSPELTKNCKGSVLTRDVFFQ